MIENIVRLRRKGLSFRQIALELDSTVGKVQYRWNKHKKMIQKEDEYLNHSLKNTTQEEIGQESIMSYSYEFNQLTAMVRNARTIYVYWEIAKTMQQLVANNIRTPWNELPKSLMVYDITAINFNGHNAHRSLEIPLPVNTNNWFILNLEPNRTYLVDYGTKTTSGGYFAIIRSNPVDTPRTHPTQAGALCEDVQNWKNGNAVQPNWLENFSCYSYYQKVNS